VINLGDKGITINANFNSFFKKIIQISFGKTFLQDTFGNV